MAHHIRAVLDRPHPPAKGEIGQMAPAGPDDANADARDWALANRDRLADTAAGSSPWAPLCEQPIAYLDAEQDR